MKNVLKRVGRGIGITLLILVVALLTAWVCLAVYYSNIPGAYLRSALAAVFALATAAAFYFLPQRCRTLVWFFVCCAAIIAWWMTIPASDARNWEREVARAPHAEIRGNLVTIYDIRNFNYRAEKDFDALYYNKTFDLSKLDSADLIAVYWMGDAVAHIMMSFGFENKEFITFSVETRKERGEDYSTIKGFFKQYELIFIAGDERDLIRVRTDYRSPQEDVYLYRLCAKPHQIRELFLAYVRQINDMKRSPEWYNTLTTNCSTSVVQLIRVTGGRARYTWKVLLSGYAPLYAYENGSLATGFTFAELKNRSYVNSKAHTIGNDPEFSRKIRDGLPIACR